MFGYINSHHQSAQKKRKSFDSYPQNLVSGLKPYNKLICKISIKNEVENNIHTIDTAETYTCKAVQCSCV